MVTGPAATPARTAPGRLFILRPDHLGDLVLFSGALRQIRKQWPKTHITLCVRSYGRQLYAACPYVDRLFPYEDLRNVSPINRIPWFPGSRRFRQALRDRFGEWLRQNIHVPALESLRCDLAVMPLLSPEEEYHPLMQLIPAAARMSIAGNRINQSRKIDLTTRAWYTAQLDGSRVPWDFPEFELTAQFLRLMGVNTQASDLWPEFWTTDADKQKAEASMGGAAGVPTLGIAPGNAIEGKRLPPEWYARVVQEMQASPVRVALLGSPADAEMCQAIEAAIAATGKAATVLNLAGQTKVLEMIECVRRCDVFLTQETAALHMATGLRTPVAGIVGGGHFGRFYPWGDPQTARVLTNRLDCFGCNWECAFEKMRCIQDIPPAQAANELNGLLTGARVG